MGFKSLIQKQVQGAMKTLGTDEDGLARTRTYVQVAEGVYNPSTQRVTAVETEYADVPMALVRFSIDDMDEEVRPQTDRVSLIAALDLSVTPVENDKIKDSDGIIYTVKRIMSDPADALYKLHVRRE